MYLYPAYFPDLNVDFVCNVQSSRDESEDDEDEFNPKKLVRPTFAIRADHQPHSILENLDFSKILHWYRADSNTILEIWGWFPENYKFETFDSKKIIRDISFDDPDPLFFGAQETPACCGINTYHSCQHEQFAVYALHYWGSRPHPYTPEEIRTRVFSNFLNSTTAKFYTEAKYTNTELYGKLLNKRVLFENANGRLWFVPPQLQNSGIIQRISPENKYETLQTKTNIHWFMKPVITAIPVPWRGHET